MCASTDILTAQIAVAIVTVGNDHSLLADYLRILMDGGAITWGNSNCCRKTDPLLESIVGDIRELQRRYDDPQGVVYDYALRLARREVGLP